jgi:hypothetical protein
MVSKTPNPWPPAHLALPDTIEAIEQGRRTQRQLFPVVPNDSRAARLARLGWQLTTENRTAATFWPH